MNIHLHIRASLIAFKDWFRQSDWLGKERDCVNLFAMKFLAEGVGTEVSPIKELSQIRIECAVPQLARCAKQAVCKDLVIWRDPLQTTWDNDFKAFHLPWVVMEWKCKRGGRAPDAFSAYDVAWLRDFTSAHPTVTGYLVVVYHGANGRDVVWQRVQKGELVGRDKFGTSQSNKG